jgi:DNA-binding response OmpR family regulator
VVISSSRVLVADDEPAIRRLISTALGRAGFEVDTAEDGGAVIRRMEAGDRYDLVLLDLIMPGKEGIETMLEIRRRWPRCKLMAMSGGGRIGVRQVLDLASALGSDRTLAKPFTPAEVVSQVRAALT